MYYFRRPNTTAEGICFETKAKMNVNSFTSCGDVVLVGNKVSSIENPYIAVAQDWLWVRVYDNFKMKQI